MKTIGFTQLSCEASSTAVVKPGHVRHCNVIKVTQQTTKLISEYPAYVNSIDMSNNVYETLYEHSVTQTTS